MTEPISCEMLKNAINQICPDGKTSLNNIKVVDYEGNKFIALDANDSTLLGNLARKIVGQSAEPAEPAKPVIKSKLENMSEQMGITPEKLSEYLKENELEDLVIDEGIVGKADETIQIAICNNYKELALVFASKFEEILKFGKDDKKSVKKLFEVIRYISDRNEKTENEFISRRVATKFINMILTTNNNTVAPENTKYIEFGIKQNSEEHKILSEKNYYDSTIVVEAQIELCLNFLRRILLIIYRDFEKENKIKKEDGTIELKYQVQISDEKDADNIVNQEILNEKLDAIFGLKLENYIDNTIDIIVDDTYAPNKIDAKFSSWRISKNTTVFELISIIKSISVYLRKKL